MPTIHELKEQAITETPLILFECALADGTVERWSTHRVTVDGHVFDARVTRHNLFEMKWGADDGIDSVSRVAFTLNNADSHFSQITQSPGWKGAPLTAVFRFYDLRAGAAASEPMVLFRGLLNPPDEITETTIRLSASNRLNPQRLMLPSIRIQRRCPWAFPSTAARRAEAVDGGAAGNYSLFRRCGYSPDQVGGLGSLDAGAPFTACDYTRASCEARGMFDRDDQNRVTRRFGGVEFVPASTLVRAHGEQGWHAAAVADNQARYNDYVPVVYGTAWLNPPVVFARNDGNLTRMEVLLGVGEINRVLKVVINGIEVPQGVAGQNMTGTGWYNVVSAGAVEGGFNLDFTSASGAPLGDPYGSMAFASAVVPNRVSDSRSIPRVSVLVEGLKLARFAEDGSFLGESFTNNPAWVLLDLLRRCGWTMDDIDAPSFARAAAHCGELIAATDLNGTPVQIPRFACNLVMRRRRSAADWIRGVRNASRLFLSYAPDGKLELRVESSVAAQQAVKPAGSNAAAELAGGWPAYEFGDGSGLTGIARRASGESSVRLWSRGAADTPNRVSIEFQDEFNEYQQDSLSLVDLDDAALSRQETSVTSTALGVSNFHQAARVLRLQLDKAVRGNSFIEFETSVRAAGLRPGDLITVTYAKDGLSRRPFRVTRIAPALNFGRALIEAQAHEDAWYGDGATGSNDGQGRRADAAVGAPRPLAGALVDADGLEQFGVAESESGGEVDLEVSFAAPSRPAAAALSIPRLSLTPSVATVGGALAGGQTLYYAITAVDSAGSETEPSFTVRASIAEGTNTNRVTLAGLSFAPGTASFHVYRGRTPRQLYRVASNEAPAASFTDAGLASILAGPPDASFDHAEFEWRLELVPQTAATVFSAAMIGSTALTLTPDEFAGMVVRVTKGKGAGQERVIESHDATTITVRGQWSVTPDASSHFAVVESGWRFGASSATSPVRFRVPNRPGATVQITGRAFNAIGRDSGYELALVTRWSIGGIAGTDADVPPAPSFGLQPAGQGTVEVVAVAFSTLENTRSIAAGTLRLFYWNELAGAPSLELVAGVSAEDSTLTLSEAWSGGPLLQIADEVMEVVSAVGGSVTVDRGSHGTTPRVHAADSPVYALLSKVFVVPFPREFFGSPASGSLAFPVFLPDARVAAADFHVTNARGNSETTKASFTATVDDGLRTLSGGQLTMQVEGFLAIQTSAVPPLVIEDGHSVRDVFAVVREAPTGAPVELALTLDGEPWCALTISAGETMSNVVNGWGLGPLPAMSRLSLDVASVGSTFSTAPGRDLTVTVRL